ncbi:hypothetical protein AB6D90_20450 [Vibrio splendidus]
MTLGFVVTCFFAYATYTFVILDLALGVRDKTAEIEVSYSDGMMVVITLFLFAYTVPFLILNRKRMGAPLELWEMYCAKTLSIFSVIALSLVICVGVIFKKYEVSYLKATGYEYSHTEENNRIFGFDTDIYIRVTD